MNNISDIIEKIQKHRNPKYFLWNFIKDIKWIELEKHNEWLIGKNDDIIYFNYNKINHILHYEYGKICSVLETKYHLNEEKANKLVGDMVGEHFKLTVNKTKPKFGVFPTK
jgi:hypothetical protein